MSDLFTRMCCRMDGVTIRVMGKQAEINGTVYDVMPEEEPAEMGALSGSQLSLVVFSDQYRPARHDVVVFGGRTLVVTRYDTYNGKPRIFVEQE
ncbi:DNA breaking-rejoining protein [Escherichia coli]|nr:DNA breaking-rejoining protein [Escherichia coli]EJN3776956.1 DNA breaking-rejoining protein [Escherichia coli]EJN4323841.1 DNA breaking-rejoining protein [Escherichia coli]EJN4387930.1 DNA breaking-rejoining protein [Escherichia coli]EJN4421652.1 DNA breaking-rejoining protein [Escherichia coli]